MNACELWSVAGAGEDVHQNPLELRLLIEFFVATWRCALDEWLPDCTPGELPELLRLACSSMNSALDLEA